MADTAAGAAAAVSPQAASPAAQAAPKPWKPFGRSVYSPSMEFLARLQLDSTGLVTLRTPTDSVVVSRFAFTMLAKDYLKADSTRHQTNIGVLDGQAIVEMRAWVAALLVGGLLLVLVLAWRVRKLQRLRTEEQRETERVAEQRRTVEAAREAERQLLAQNLHDDVLQMIYAIRLHIPESLVASSLSLQTVDGLLVQTADRVRAVTAQLRSPLDDTIGLEAALRALCVRYPGLNCTIELTPNALEALTPEATLTVYRLGQEAVSNAVRHGRAAHVRFHLTRPAAGRLAFVVDDDGEGFTSSQAPHDDGRAHFGLVGMRERVEALGGTLIVTSSPGAGTRVEAGLPS